MSRNNARRVNEMAIAKFKPRIWKLRKHFPAVSFLTTVIAKERYEAIVADGRCLWCMMPICKKPSYSTDEETGEKFPNGGFFFGCRAQCGWYMSYYEPGKPLRIRSGARIVRDRVEAHEKMLGDKLQRTV